MQSELECVRETVSDWREIYNLPDWFINSFVKEYLYDLF